MASGLSGSNRNKKTLNFKTSMFYRSFVSLLFLILNFNNNIVITFTFCVISIFYILYMMDDDTIIVPWIGPTCCKKNINVAVISSNADITENLSEALLDVQARGCHRWKLAVLRSLSLEDIVRQSNVTGKLALDFIIIAIDSTRIFCVEWAKKMLEQVHPDLRIRRVVLVNASGLPINAMAVSASEIISFCTENRLDMVNANVSIATEAQFLARKLIKYMEVSIGTKTGIPNLNI